MTPKRSEKASSLFPAVEEVLEKKLEDIILVLRSSDGKKSRVYEDVLSMVEKGMLKIALRHSKNIKTAAASYLGINRNTFQKKMIKLGIDRGKE
jgi:DNA-binding protein Fis